MSNRVTADMTPAEAAAVATYVDSDEWTVFEDHLFVACCDCGLAHRVEVRQHNVGQRAIRFIRLDEFTAEIRKRQQAEHATHESRSAGNGGEPKACTPAEERGYAGATGAGQLPDGDEERLVTVRKGAHPLANNATPAPDEGNRL